MTKHLKNLFACMILLSIGLPLAIAQSGTYYTVQDFQFWSAVELKYKASKKLSLTLEQQLRLRDDASNVDIYFTELGLGYKIDKHFGLGLNGRFIRDNDDQGKIQGYENHFRWNIDGSYKHDIKRLDLKYRLRFQSKNEMGLAADQQEPATSTARLKVGADYNFKSWKLDPEFSTEIFDQLGSDDQFDKIRFTLGTTYQTKSYADFSAFFRMEKELKSLYPKTTNIVGFKYRYTLKRKKNEK